MGPDKLFNTPSNPTHLTAFEKSKHPTPRSKVPRPITCRVTRLTESHTLTWGCKGCVKKQQDKQRHQQRQHHRQVSSFVQQMLPELQTAGWNAGWPVLMMLLGSLLKLRRWESRHPCSLHLCYKHVSGCHCGKKWSIVAFRSCENKSLPSIRHRTHNGGVILHFRPQI